MTHKFTQLENGKTEIEVSYIDEGIELEGKTTIVGDETVATRYLPFFEKDLRANYKHLFPIPEPEVYPEEGELI